MLNSLHMAISGIFRSHNETIRRCAEHVSLYGVPSPAFIGPIFTRVIQSRMFTYDAGFWMYVIHADTSRRAIPVVVVQHPWPHNEQFDTYLEAMAGMATIIAAIFGRCANMSSGEIAVYAHGTWRSIAHILRAHMSDVRKTLNADPVPRIVGTAGINSLLKKMTI
jgi:hypothetical protein